MRIPTMVIWELLWLVYGRWGLAAGLLAAVALVGRTLGGSKRFPAGGRSDPAPSTGSGAGRKALVGATPGVVGQPGEEKAEDRQDDADRDHGCDQHEIACDSARGVTGPPRSRQLCGRAREPAHARARRARSRPLPRRRADRRDSLCSSARRAWRSASSAVSSASARFSLSSSECSLALAARVCASSRWASARSASRSRSSRRRAVARRPMTAAAATSTNTTITMTTISTAVISSSPLVRAGGDSRRPAWP